jgi:hypothetical protein
MPKIEDDVPLPMTYRVIKKLKAASKELPALDDFDQLSAYRFAQRVLEELEPGQSCWTKVSSLPLAQRLSMSYHVIALRRGLSVTSKREVNPETGQMGVRVWRIV